MWIKFETVPSDHDAIYLPSSLAMLFDEYASVKFGGRELQKVEVLLLDQEETTESTFQQPVMLRISNQLREKLLLPVSLTYRVRISGSQILIGPVIGLLLGVHTHRYNPKHMQKYSDRLGIYHQIGGLIYAFSPKSVNLEENMAYGLYYNIEASEWEYGCFPLPDVIYRRDFHSDPSYIKKLMEYTGGNLFNSYRFTKMELFDYLSSDEEISQYLPPTELSLSFEQVRKFIERYRKVILKPVDLSRGRGICVIEKSDFDYRITDYRYKNPIPSVLNDDEALERFFSLNQGFFSKYLIQQYLELARIGSSLFDIRVVMQKGADRSWGCTGIECRVSGGSSHITNIARGGHALTLDEALKQSFLQNYEDIPEKINKLCLKFCARMDRMGHHFAEFGMDIAIDAHRNIWIIEANVFPSFKGFKATDWNTYLLIRYKPLLYALSLTKFSE